MRRSMNIALVLTACLITAQVVAGDLSGAPIAAPRKTPAIEAATQPAQQPPQAQAEAKEGAKVNPGSDVELNPQPLPPKATEEATATRARGADAQAPAVVDPSAKVILNPQPLPPKTTVIKPREPVVIQSGPTQTRDASGQVSPKTPIQGAARLPTAPGSPYGEAVEIKTEQIICRGGGSFNLGKLDISPYEDQLAAGEQGLVFGNKQYKKTPGDLAVLMQLNFVPARNGRNMTVPAGENAQGLTKGSTCSFVTRGFQHDDPVGIRFETLRQLTPESRQGPGPGPNSKVAAEFRADSQTIPEYLGFEDNYWTFLVYKRPYGHFRAVSHGPWKPKSATQIAGTARNAGGSNLVVARLTNVKVFPSMAGVGFRFTARPNASPAIELSREAPVTGRDRLAVFRDPLRMKADRDNKNSTEAITQYVGASEAQGIKLRQDAAYHYIITVPGEGSIPTQQATGTFNTLYQTVTVYISGLRLLSVGDNDEKGNLNFYFLLNPGESNRQKWSTGKVEWAPGKYRLDRVFKFRGDLERLRILVEGWDAEDGAMACFTGLPPDNDPTYFDSAQPSGACSDMNVGKREFLRGSRELSVANQNWPFTIPALVGPHGSELAFEVSGSIEVTRP